MARTGLLAFIALLIPGVCHAAPAPDYVLTQTWRDGTTTRTQSIFHHAGWFRIDQPDGSYFETSRQGFQFAVTHYRQAKTDAVSFWRRSPLIAAPTGHRQAMGATSVIAGEPCSLWRISERQGNSEVPTREGCTTADGIDLWNGAPSAAPPLTVRLERRAVLAAEVTPPLGLLDLDAWPYPIMPANPEDSNGDFEILLTRTSQPRDGLRDPRNWKFFKSGAWSGNRISSDGRTFGHATALSPDGIVSIAYEIQAGHLQTMRIGVQPTKPQPPPPYAPRLAEFAL